MTQEKSQHFLHELPGLKGDLPFSPNLFRQLYKQTSDDSLSSLEQIGDTLGKDQGLAARILRLANSAYYGLQADVRSVERAATVIGLNEIRNIVLAIGIHGLTSRYPLPKELDIEEYWKHHFMVGLLAKELSSTSGIGSPENMFTVGLLHDLGKLITALKHPDDWLAMRQLAKAEQIMDTEAEDQYWGVDHAVIGALVLKSWDLPADLLEPVNWHHAPHLAPTHSRESSVVALADYASHAAIDPNGPYAGRVEKLCVELDMDLDLVADLAEELSESEEVDAFVRQLK